MFDGGGSKVRLSLIVLGVLALSAATAGPVWADSPGPPGFVDQISAGDQKLIDAKFVVAEREQLWADSMLEKGLQPNCPIEGPGLGCPLPPAYLYTYARHQAKNIYCGPAAVQVVSNYAWGISSGNKYTQQHISDTWTHTDADNQTYVYRERNGLNGAAAGHMPPDFIYAYYQASSGSDWHNKLRVDISTYKMPQVVKVAPHNVGASYWLSSWPNAINTGHYIVMNGWYAIWDGTRDPWVWYDDGSDGYGGKTGQFDDPAYDVWYTIDHSDNWIIW